MRGVFPAVALCVSVLALTQAPGAVKSGTERREAVLTALRQREIFTGESGLMGNGFLSRDQITTEASLGPVIVE